MKCPECGYYNKSTFTECFRCGSKLPESHSDFDYEDELMPRQQQKHSHIKTNKYSSLSKNSNHKPNRTNFSLSYTKFITATLNLLLIFFVLVGLVYGAMRGVQWASTRLIASAPHVEPDRYIEIKPIMQDEIASHEITLFGNEGDNIFINELKRSYQIVGGKSVIIVPDSQWFQGNLDASIESMNISLTLIKSSTSGERFSLPPVSFDVQVPVSPIKLINPTELRSEVIYAMCAIKLQVMPGSHVWVGGNSVTDLVDKDGNISINQAVDSNGENNVSIIVQTQNHRENRIDLVLFRQKQDVPIELDINTTQTTSQKTVTMRGTTVLGATIVCETPYSAEDSTYDDTTGAFSIKAKMEAIGENIVRIKAKKDDKETVITHTVTYVPAIDAYSKSAWKMDYDELMKFFGAWQGRIFVCEGVVTSILSTEPQVVLFDIGSDSEQIIAVQNCSSKAVFLEDARYKIYADVNGSKEDYPLLMGRYVYPK